MTKAKVVGVLALCTVLTTALDTTAGFPAWADGRAAGIYRVPFELQHIAQGQPRVLEA